MATYKYTLIKKDMCSIQNKLKLLLKSDDPNQQSIGLLAMLIDDRFNKTQDLLDSHGKIFDSIDGRLKKLETCCPLNVDKELKALDKDLKIVRFFSTNWKLLLVVIAAIIIVAAKGTITKFLGF